MVHITTVLEQELHSSISPQDEKQVETVCPKPLLFSGNAHKRIEWFSHKLLLIHFIVSLFNNYKTRQT